MLDNKKKFSTFISSDPLLLTFQDLLSIFLPVIIATKLDKIKRSQIQKQVKILREGLGMSKEGMLVPFSAETKQGLENIWEIIDNAVLKTE